MKKRGKKILPPMPTRQLINSLQPRAQFEVGDARSKLPYLACQLITKRKLANKIARFAVGIDSTKQKFDFCIHPHTPLRLDR
jgi:hypothetical protein